MSDYSAEIIYPRTPPLSSRFVLLAGSTAFTTISYYITSVECPALLTLDDKNALKHWKSMYSRASKIYGKIAFFTGTIGALIGIFQGEKTWLIGAGLMFSHWPYTIYCVMPISIQLNSTSEDKAGPETRSLIHQWNSRHKFRTFLGFAAFGVFAYAIMNELSTGKVLNN